MIFDVYDPAFRQTHPKVLLKISAMFRIRPVFCALLLVVSVNTSAQLVKWEAHGTVNSDLDPYPERQFNNGDPVSLIAFVDIAAPDVFPDDPINGHYDVLAFEGHIGTFVVTQNSAEALLRVFDYETYGHVQLGIHSETIGPVAGYTLYQFAVALFWDGDMLTSDAIPLSLPDFTSVAFDMDITNGTDFHLIFFHLSSISIDLVPVPLPPALALLATGLAGLAGTVKRCRTKATSCVTSPGLRGPSGHVWSKRSC